MGDTQASGGRVGGPQRRQLAAALLCILAVVAAAFLAPPLAGVGGAGGGGGGDGPDGGSPDGGGDAGPGDGDGDGDGGFDLPLDWLFPWGDGGGGGEVERGPVNCVVTLGSEPVPGKDLRVRVRRNDQPVTDRPVRFNGRLVGRTNERGVVSGRVPYERRLRVTVALASGGRCRFLGSISDRPGADSLSGSPGAPGDPAGATGFVTAPLSRTVGVADPTGTRQATTGPAAAGNDSERSYAVPGAGATNSTGNYTVEGAVTVDVSGRLVPGRTVTLRATVEEVPMRNASVSLDGERVGSTGDRGRYSLAVPERDSARVVVSRGDFAGDAVLDVEYLRLRVTPAEGLPFPGEPAVVNASVNGDPVVGETVRIDGTGRGTTGQGGLFRFALPADPRTGVAVSALDQRRTRSLWAVYAPTLGGLAAIALLGTVTTGAAGLRGRRRLARQLGVGWVALAGAFLAVVVAELWGVLLAVAVALVAAVVRLRRDIGEAGRSSASLFARLARWCWRGCRRVAALLERGVVRGWALLGRVRAWLGTLPRSASGLLGRLASWFRSLPGRVGAVVASVGPARLAAAALALTVVAASTVVAGPPGLAVSTLAVLVAAGLWWVLTRDDADDADDGTDEPTDGVASRRAVRAEPTSAEDPSLRELWRHFARRVAPGTWRVRTPGEVSRIAIETGYPREPVRTLTRAFRDVEYGGRPLSDSRYERASEAFDALRSADRTDEPDADRREADP